MATALFIKTADIVKKTAMSGTVDSNKFLQFVELAQEIHVQGLLGTDLYDKISEDIVNNVLTGDYKVLVDDYINPLLIQFGMAEYLPFAAYSIANGGVFKHLPSDSEVAQKDEIDFLIQKHRDFASHYADRLVDYLCYNAREKFPEYYTNTEDDIRPDNQTTYTSWNLR